MTGVMRHVHLEAQSAVLERIAGTAVLSHLLLFWGSRTTTKVAVTNKTN